ncbi:MAG: GHKL domain-containing protein [Calditrichaeota bacterium]|nr:MAG: GHKL domain-containing protein [Calditrichota bacterium]MBL1207722.1 GHKL domain-containing protein [Calditrichota bacterium]NOG47556.1 GHKL domain-containing protein [Calditrichota bacterium]
MLSNGLILVVSFIYIAILFAVARYGDKRSDEKRSIISNPYIYALSMAVYCSAWTFYGSVGKAANSGIGFLPVYLGPTLMAPLFWIILRKMIRIAKKHRITSIADFISSRYGKSILIGSTVTLIAVTGILPYIALQLKAVSSSYFILSNYPDLITSSNFKDIPFFEDTAFYITLLLALFAIVFGTRHIDATERHEGLVTAIAFESFVKLFAFLIIGFFVTYSLHDGFGDLFTKAKSLTNFDSLFSEPTIIQSGSWFGLTFLSMLAILFLPRQFQVSVVENVNEDHLKKAVWIFPLYLLIINIFVIPIALGGLLHFEGSPIDADTFVLTLPLAVGQTGIALLVFLGGLSAATGMVIVATVALSTMFSNDMLMPLILRLKFLKLNEEKDLRWLLLLIRRGTIILILLLSYFYYRVIESHYSLVSIGLISFTAVAQFAPIILGGMYWKGGTKYGALAGMLAGFLVWGFTLALPSLVPAGIVSPMLMEEGLFGISLFKPMAFLGLTGLDSITHALFWSILFNCFFYFGVSILGRPSAIEYSQAALFVDIDKYSPEFEHRAIGQGTASIDDLRTLLKRFIGSKRTERLLSYYAKKNNLDWETRPLADAGLINFVEKRLSGVIGSSSARIMVSSVVKEKKVSIDDVMKILSETQQVIAYSQELEKKSMELEKATDELKRANQKLKKMDQFKDDFIATITHELRTPLTSVRAFTEILYDNPEIDIRQRQNFLNIIIKETERLTRLINQILDIQKIESQEMDWQFSPVSLNEIIEDSIATMGKVFEDQKITLEIVNEHNYLLNGDKDKLMQVMLNLLSNAVKYCNKDESFIKISSEKRNSVIQIDIEDNGMGVHEDDQTIIFEKFRQATKIDPDKERPQGSGLGLSITRQIVEAHGGSIWVKSKPGQGAKFSFSLPFSSKLQQGERV